MYSNLLFLYLSNHQWKKIIYQLRKSLKPICAGELSKLFTHLYSVGPEKVQEYRQKNQKYPVIVIFYCLFEYDFY